MVAAEAHRERPERQATVEPEAVDPGPERLGGLLEREDAGLHVPAADQLDHLPRSPRSVPDRSGYVEETPGRCASRVVQTVLAVLSPIAVLVVPLLMLRLFAAGAIKTNGVP